MTTQTTQPAPTADVGVLLQYEFEPPCQHSQHHETHVAEQPASWVITVATCSRCGEPGGTYLLCDSGLESIREGAVCSRYHYMPFAEGVIAVVSIGGGRP